MNVTLAPTPKETGKKKYHHSPEPAVKINNKWAKRINICVLAMGRARSPHLLSDGASDKTCSTNTAEELRPSKESIIESLVGRQCLKHGVEPWS